MYGDLATGTTPILCSYLLHFHHTLTLDFSTSRKGKVLYASTHVYISAHLKGPKPKINRPNAPNWSKKLYH